MADGEDWLMRPVNEGLCRYESLKDGTLTLADIAMLNEMIDVRQENAARAQRAAQEKAKSQTNRR